MSDPLPIKYQIIERTSSAALADGVNQAIADGFEPIGGVYVCEYHIEKDPIYDMPITRVSFSQAVIKRET